MRFLLLSLILLFAATSSARSAELSPELQELKEAREGRVSVGGFASYDKENDMGEDVEAIKFNTYQDEEDTLTYRVRVTAEVTDKEKNVYFAQIQVGQGSLNEDYTGEDAWEFQIPHGDLKRFKISAYIIQYGFLQGTTFVPIAEYNDDADTPEEIIERATAGRLDIKCSNHTYRYEDGDEILDSTSNHESLH